MARGRTSNLTVAQTLLDTLTIINQLKQKYDSVDDPEYGEIIKVSLSEVANALGMPEDKARSTIEQLSCCEFGGSGPGFFIEKDMVYIWSHLPLEQTPLRLTEQETRALILALYSAGIQADDSLAQALASTLATPENADPQILKTVTFGPARTSEHTLDVISEAIASQKQVRLFYVSYASQEVKERVIEPLQLLHSDEAWHVYAFCHLTGDYRTFRLDRIKDLQLLDIHFDPHDVEEISQPISFEDAPQAKLLIKNPALLEEWVWPGLEIVAEHSDGTIEATLPYVGTKWIAHRIVSCLGDVQVVDTPEVSDAVKRLAASLLSEFSEA